MKVLAFGATNSKKSINKQLAHYAAKQVQGNDISLIDINDYEMEIYSEEREKDSGIPAQAHHFYKAIGDADLVVISFAEYNGTYTAAYKNLTDWTSRISTQFFQDKPVLMLATSPGAGGAQSVLAAAESSAHYFAANVLGALSLPSFYDNFDSERGIVTHNEFNQQLTGILATHNLSTQNIEATQA